MPFSLPRLITCLAICTCIGGCSRADSDAITVGADCRVTPRPFTVGPAHLDCLLYDSDDAPLTGASVRMEANMTHPGMSPVQTRLRELAPGRYEAGFELSMAGDWYLVLAGRTEEGASFEHQIDLRGVQPE